MRPVTQLIFALAAPATIHGLVFKAVSRCTNSVNPVGGGAAPTFCDTPGLLGYADDGTQLTFNGGVSEPGLKMDSSGCYSTNGDFNGAAFGVDSSPGHYDGGLINFSSCGIAKGVSYGDCQAIVNGKVGPKSTKTNCNNCSADGFFAYCTCCAVTY